jgi:hypothetical protein
VITAALACSRADFELRVCFGTGAAGSMKEMVLSRLNQRSQQQGRTRRVRSRRLSYRALRCRTLRSMTLAVLSGATASARSLDGKSVTRAKSVR